GRLGYTDAVRQGIYTPLGEGDVDFAAVVAALDAVGFTGWYVLEQDTVLTAEPPAGDGPVHDVRRSLEYLRSRHPGRVRAPVGPWPRLTAPPAAPSADTLAGGERPDDGCCADDRRRARVRRTGVRPTREAQPRPARGAHRRAPGPRPPPRPHHGGAGGAQPAVPLTGQPRQRRPGGVGRRHSRPGPAARHHHGRHRPVRRFRRGDVEHPRGAVDPRARPRLRL